MPGSVVATMFVGVLLAAVGPSGAQNKDSLVLGKTLSQWVAEIKSRDPSVAENALHAVIQYGQNAQKEAGPAIIGRLNDPDVSLRVNAAIALGEIGLAPKDVPAGVGGLTRLLTDPQAIVRFHAAAALGGLGADARGAIPNLLYAVRDKSSWEIRKAAAYALGAVARVPGNTPDPRALEALTKTLADGCSQVRLAALLALTNLGPPALAADREVVILALQNLLQDRQPTVVIWTHMALMQYTRISEDHLAAIAKFLKSPDLEARSQAANALATIGSEASSVIPDLVEALKDPAPEGARAAADALFQMRNSLSDKNLQDIAQLLAYPDPQVRKQAAGLLGILNANPRIQVAALVDALQDKDSQVVLAVLQALGELGETAQSAVPALTKLAEGPDDILRLAAVDALQRIAHKDTVPPTP
ncbi:MAG: HEAT repeat domain-containing protein [Planctomycetes bacterium]|nr:HEAT repeat domain-containing protein [Planctomycetota bacterium]